MPIDYEVVRVRDGRSFATRLVLAKQKQCTVFAATISFHVREPDSIQHEPVMPDVPPPEECEDAESLYQR